MPSIQSLAITQFRNLDSAQLEPGPGINLIVGANGSGKTSLLEALSVLAHGRSFRTHKFRRLINHNHHDFTLFSQLQSAEGLVHRLGIQRSSNGAVSIKIDGKPAYSATELAEMLPLLVMNANSFQLLEGSSKYRRQFFDWLVFHVKHSFKNAWKGYVRCVKHRNTLLRRGKISTSELRPWDAELVQLAEVINGCRTEVFSDFQQEYIKRLEAFKFNDDSLDFSLDYYPGWKVGEEDLQTQLDQSLERDLKLGYTTLGPHKSDIKISIGKIPAVEKLSRGQQKSVITTLYLSAASVFSSVTGRQPVFLLDDLPAELDRDNLRIVGDAVEALNSQVFVTAIEPEAITSVWETGREERPFKLFHVEHGVLRGADNETARD